MVTCWGKAIRDGGGAHVSLHWERCGGQALDSWVVRPMSPSPFPDYVASGKPFNFGDLLSTIAHCGKEKYPSHKTVRIGQTDALTLLRMVQDTL